MPGVVRVRYTYLTLTLFSTLATSMIWGVNTLLLLDAGLTNTQAFGANAAYSVGQLVFEVPTGVVADTRGRKLSYVLGAGTLLASTLLYLYMWQTRAPFIGWALASVVLGLGYTFFSGAVEAWLVDALNANGYEGDIDTVFGQGQAVFGGAMMVGSLSGGFIAQVGSLATPYVVRAVILGLTLVLALWLMHDEGFSPDRTVRTSTAARRILRSSVEFGWGTRPVRWLILTSPAISGVMAYIFYAMQPYLLELYGDPDAYGIAGLASAVVAGAQIVGGLAVPRLRRMARLRTTILIGATVLSIGSLFVIGFVGGLWFVLGGFVVWAITYSVATPVRQGFINGCLPSAQRATVLSFDALVGSAGGTVAQPALGRVADVAGYGASYTVTAVVQVLAVPFFLLARKEQSPGDPIPEPA